MNILFLDDWREPEYITGKWLQPGWFQIPSGSKIMTVRSYDEFAAVWRLVRRKFDLISLDHDLGEGKTGYDCACLLEEIAHDDPTWFKDTLFQCHSSNPIGAMRIGQVFDSILNMSSK